MPKVSVQLSDEVHAAVRVRAFRDGVTLNDLGRGWFETYADGGMLVAGGLAAGDQPGMGTSQGQSVVNPSGGGSTTPTVGVTGARPAPAAKPCSRKARHHINHGGNPCPECGWPDTADWKKGKK